MAGLAEHLARQHGLSLASRLLLPARQPPLPRTAAAGGASDSSGMAAAMFRPPTPEVEEVVEELCVEVGAWGTWTRELWGIT